MFPTCLSFVDEGPRFRDIIANTRRTGDVMSAPESVAAVCESKTKFFLDVCPCLAFSLELALDGLGWAELEGGACVSVSCMHDACFQIF